LSGKAKKPREDGGADRRVRRTRKAVLDAFSALVLDRRYDEIRVADIAGEADVGRSTLYQHFTGKDEIFLQSMAGILDVLAGTVEDDFDPGPLEHVLGHFLENRTLARYLFSGPPGSVLTPRIARELAARIETRLGDRCREQGLEPSLPLPLIAAHLGEAQLALVRGWLAGDERCDAKELAAGMRASVRGAVAALLTDGP
jgi:AcrR family transcriptional regulator